MTWLEKIWLCLGAIAMLMVLKPWRHRSNINPSPIMRRVPRPGEWPGPPRHVPPHPLPPGFKESWQSENASKQVSSTAPRREGATMEDEITITKPQLRSALLAWVQQYRDGKTRTSEEAAALPVEQVADESADHLWQALREPVAA